MWHRSHWISTMFWICLTNSARKLKGLKGESVCAVVTTYPVQSPYPPPAPYPATAPYPGVAPYPATQYPMPAPTASAPDAHGESSSCRADCMLATLWCQSTGKGSFALQHLWRMYSVCDRLANEPPQCRNVPLLADALLYLVHYTISY